MSQKGPTNFFRKNFDRMFYRAGIHGPKPVGPGPSGSVLVLGKNRNLGPDQDWKNFENLGPIRTGRSPDLAVRGSLLQGVEVFKNFIPNKIPGLY